MQGRIAISYWSHSISRKINYPQSTAATKLLVAIDLHIHFLQFVNCLLVQVEREKRRCQNLNTLTSHQMSTHTEICVKYIWKSLKKSNTFDFDQKYLTFLHKNYNGKQVWQFGQIYLTKSQICLTFKIEIFKVKYTCPSQIYLTYFWT